MKFLTIEDIRNPARVSGFDHVSKKAGRGGVGRRKQWLAVAYRGTRDKAGRSWTGPQRRTPEEAAQDYCDHVNAAPITIEDIRNPARKSGFDFVATHPSWSTSAGDRYRAQYQRVAPHWYGPTRGSAEEAAQDYCDYVNNLPGAASTPPANLTSHGHTRSRPRRKIERNDREKAALKTLREEAAKRKVEQANYVYLVGMEANPAYVKIGEAFDPEDRYIGGQTFNPYTLVLLGFLKVDTGTGADKLLHRKFQKHQHKAEWFVPADAILAHFGVKRDEFLRRCGGTTKEAKTPA